MFTKKMVGIPRRYQFLQKIHDALGASETIYMPYTAQKFIEFLLMAINSGQNLKIYIATIADRLTLVYAINNVHQPGNQLYYLFDTNNFVQIDEGTAENFIRNYQKFKLPMINSIYNPPLKKGNTTVIFFTPGHLRELRDEIICQQATGVRAYFACYMDTEPSLAGRDYERRLHIEFVLTKLNAQGKEEEFYIDDCSDFHRRPGADQEKSFNNGTLCPPCQNCYDNNVPAGLVPQDCLTQTNNGAA